MSSQLMKKHRELFRKSPESRMVRGSPCGKEISALFASTVVLKYEDEGRMSGLEKTGDKLTVCIEAKRSSYLDYWKNFISVGDTMLRLGAAPKSAPTEPEALESDDPAPAD